MMTNADFVAAVFPSVPEGAFAATYLENGALRPVRICGRLAWNVAEIKKLLSGGAV